MVRLVILFQLLLFFNLFGYPITEKNISQYKIFTNLERAGSVLKENLQKIPGISLKYYMLDEPRIEEKGLYLFVCKDHCFGFSTDSLSPDGFRITKLDENILVISKTPQGLIYGTYFLLEKLGFVFLSQDFIHVPEKFYIDRIDVEENPSFLYREIFVKELDDPDFAEVLRLNGRLGHRENRPLKYGNIFILTVSLNDIVPKERYQKTDPEYFCGNQLDFTNDEVKEIARINTDRILSRHRDLENLHLLISTNDINDYCRNSSSLKRINEGGAPSTPYIDFVRYIAEGLREEYPHVKFLALAYQWSRKPPKKYPKLPENMGIFFSTIDADFSKPLLIRNNTYILRDLEKWTGITDYIFIWHYIANFGNYLIPFPNIYQVADDIKYFSSKKEIKGVFLQGAYNTYGSDMVELKSWLFSKLLWNPRLNVDNLLETFLHYYYGKGAEEVEKYIDTLYRYVKDPRIILSVKTPPTYLDTDLLMELLGLLKRAKEKEKLLQKHIDRLIFSVNTAILLNQEKFSNTEIVRQAKESVLEKIDTYKISRYSENGSVEDLKNIPVSIKSPIKPDTVTTSRWIDFQEFSMKICCGDIIEDRYASNGIAVAVAGWKTDWAVQLDLKDLPEGKWDIYFVIRVQANEGIDPQGIKAFRYGVYPADNEKEAFLEDFYDGEYKTVYIGRFAGNSELVLWIAPAGDNRIEYILVDRIFAVYSGQD